VWSKCNHANVQKLLGIAQVRNQIAMVSPWMVNGDVRAYLRLNVDLDRCSMVGVVMTQRRLGLMPLKQCAQIADGLAYLHEKNIVSLDPPTVD
jgi:serine/threonine protein kinase